jgi:hypothetical protein
MNIVKKIAKVTFPTHVSAMLNGLKNELPATVKGMPVNGQLETPAQVEQAFQSYLDADAAVQATKAALKNALAARLALEPTTKLTYESALAFVRSLFAGDAAKLAGCGLTEKPRTKPSAAVLAARAATRKATLEKKKAAAAAIAAAMTVATSAGGQSTSVPEAAVASTAVGK